MSEPPVEERPEVVEPVAPGKPDLTKADVEQIQIKIFEIENILTQSKPNQNILSKLSDLKSYVDGLHKELVYQDYLKSKGQ